MILPRLTLRTSVPARRQRGVALPVMLIMLVVMLVTSIYLLRSSNSTTLAVSNLAYDASLSRAADFGLYAGLEYLNSKAGVDKQSFNTSSAKGYVATMVPNVPPSDPAFWAGSTTVEDEEKNRIEYVIHRMCANTGAYNVNNNRCVTSVPSKSPPGNSLGQGESLVRDTADYDEPARLHYMITARIVGPRGGNAVNQMVVAIGV